MSSGLAERLRRLGTEPTSWSNGPGDAYAAHDHTYDKILVCEAGSIVFGLVEAGTRIELRAGDRLDLPAGTNHDALVGNEGVTCLEGHLPAGRLGGVRHQRAGEW